jgi:RNA polymerase sigma factor (sigma-70 family)
VGLKPFERVVQDHGRTVWRVCRVLLGPIEADDAWAETFLAALKAYPSLPPDSNVEAWLVTIAHRKAIDQHRLRVRTPLPVEELPERVAPPPADRDDDLWAALDALPPTQRAAVAYHHVAGLPYAQVAEILGNSEAAARRAAADGIRTLRASSIGRTTVAATGQTGSDTPRKVRK